MNSRKVAKELGISEYTVRYRAKILGITTLNYDDNDVLEISNFRSRFYEPDPGFVPGLFIQTERFYIIDSKMNYDVHT